MWSLYNYEFLKQILENNEKSAIKNNENAGNKTVGKS
jgi:hypothetical protein